MTLRHIRIFLSVFQNNGITKAAQELQPVRGPFLDQSAGIAPVGIVIIGINAGNKGGAALHESALGQHQLPAAAEHLIEKRDDQRRPLRAQQAAGRAVGKQRLDFCVSTVHIVCKSKLNPKCGQTVPRIQSPAAVLCGCISIFYALSTQRPEFDINA